MKKAIIYARVSTVEQDEGMQLADLRRAAAYKGYDIIREFVDHGISGAKDRSERPEYDALLKMVEARQCDIVMVWSIDRLGRMLRGLIDLLEFLDRYGVDLFVQQQDIDTTTPYGKAMFQMTGVFAQLERALIGERVKAGLRRAMAEGRMPGRKSILRDDPRLRKKIEYMILNGVSARKIIRNVGGGVGVGSIYDIKNKILQNY